MRSLLAYEKYKVINSQMDYIRRASLYVVCAAGLDYLHFDVNNIILDFSKGLSAGICFGNVAVGCLMGLISAGGNSVTRNMLS
jgi:hypothetical protein